MARLTLPTRIVPSRLTAPIPARQHFAAVTYLRWRLFRNGFRRKGGKGELAARIFVFPIFALFILGAILGAGSAAYAAAAHNNLAYLQVIFWVIFAGQVVVSINIAPPGLSFDPESLIRFPLSFPRYLIIRLFLGLLSVSTLVGTLALLAAATGIAIAAPALAPIAFAAAIALALANMLFTRMVFIWVDRWLSTRRARELFTALIFIASIGVQYLNVTFNGIGRHTSHAQQLEKITAFLRLYHRFEPVLRKLPPGLGGLAILNAGQHQFAAVSAAIVGILLFAAAFLAVFAWRIHREYRGENLSESASRSIAQQAVSFPQPARVPSRPAQDSRVSSLPQEHSGVSHLRDSLPVAKVGLSHEPSRRNSPHLSPIITACLRKELLYVRRNTTQFYGLVAPLAMVFIFAGRSGSFSRTGYTFPVAVTYSLLGISALAYNCFGLDASGIQFYFLAPVSLRSVVIAKNLFSFSITATQIALVFLVLCFTTGAPPLLMTVATLCWALFAAFLNVSLGNIRSITAPKKIDPGKLSRKQASQLSALMSIGLMLVLAGVGFSLFALAKAVSLPWLPIPILLALAAGAFALYLAGLSRIDGLALTHRETLIEELCKVS